MRILIISLYFPPANTMGAIRVGKWAKFLLSRGHDVRVLSAEGTGPSETMPLEISTDRVMYTPWRDINWMPKAVAGILGRLFGGVRIHNGTVSAGASASGTQTGVEKSHGWSWREVLYRSILNWPDQWVGWMPAALSGARRILSEWSPEIIYASGPPHTGLVIAHLLARRHGLPWIAELRDRWIDDPYRRYPSWRNRLEGVLLERRVLRSASAIVTVSEPWADFYAKKYGRPTQVVYNGFDSADYEGRPSPGAVGTQCLKIVYTGAIYAGRRDPSPLFQALYLMQVGEEAIRVQFFGTDEARVLPAAARHGVSHLVEVHPQVPYQESIVLQRQADVLLLIQWSNPREQGNVPGKLFEYLGARRPILGLGFEQGVPATIIRGRSAGFFSNDPELIAEQLLEWVRAKQRDGRISELPETARAGFERDNQFERLEAFLFERLSA